MANKGYLELIHLIERLHRLFLDVLRTEIKRMGIRDLNGVQAMLLANIGDQEIVIRDLIDRGYYQGSNVSYNVKKLTDMGYLEQQRAEHDKRSVTLRLTAKAQKVVDRVHELDTKNALRLAGDQGSDANLEEVCATLRELERAWTDYIRFGDS